MYLNMEDGSVAVGNPGIFLSGSLSGNPPILDMDANNKRGQVIQNPQVSCMALSALRSDPPACQDGKTAPMDLPEVQGL